MQIISDTGVKKEAEITPLMLLYQVPAAGAGPCSAPSPGQQHPLPFFPQHGFSTTFSSWQTSS